MALCYYEIIIAKREDERERDGKGKRNDRDAGFFSQVKNVAQKNDEIGFSGLDPVKIEQVIGNWGYCGSDG